jgi:hypothetical protein
MSKSNRELLDSLSKKEPQAEPESQPDADILSEMDRTGSFDIPETVKERYMNYLGEAEGGLSQGYKGMASLEGETCHWLAHMTFFRKVVKATAPKQVDLLADMIDKIKNRVFEVAITRITYAVLRAFFRLAGKSVNDKAIRQFRNAGSFLGRMTLARNRPVLINKLNLKAALVSSLSSARAELNLQVLLRVLEGGKSSIVFKDTNPWMSPLIALIREQEPRLPASVRP